MASADVQVGAVGIRSESRFGNALSGVRWFGKLRALIERWFYRMVRDTGNASCTSINAVISQGNTVSRVVVHGDNEKRSAKKVE